MAVNLRFQGQFLRQTRTFSTTAFLPSRRGPPKKATKQILAAGPPLSFPMSTLSKSPLRVARAAVAVANKVLRPYCHKFSPKLYTQPQLFACLVLKTFYKTDYRGIAMQLHEFSELRGCWCRARNEWTTTWKRRRRSKKPVFSPRPPLGNAR
jgi:hypothetical protein